MTREDKAPGERDPRFAALYQTLENAIAASSTLLASCQIVYDHLEMDQERTGRRYRLPDPVPLTADERWQDTADRIARALGADSLQEDLSRDQWRDLLDFLSALAVLASRSAFVLDHLSTENRDALATTRVVGDAWVVGRHERMIAGISASMSALVWRGMKQHGDIWAHRLFHCLEVLAAGDAALILATSKDGLLWFRSHHPAPETFLPAEIRA